MNITNSLKTLKARVTSSTADETSFEDHNTVHAKLVGPSSVTLNSDMVRSGEQWMQTRMIVGYPTSSTPGLIDQLTTAPGGNIDVSIHVAPKDIETALGQFDQKIRELKSEEMNRAESNGSVSVIRRRRERMESVRDQLIDGKQAVVDVAIYIILRADSRDELEDLASQVKNTLLRQRLRTEPIDFAQDDALLSGSPMAIDKIGSPTRMLGDGAGALFPFSSSTIMEESGVLVGYHATTNTPITVDRYNRQNGYNWAVIADIGSGKSYLSKLILLRRYAKDPDTVVVTIDPMNSSGGLSTLIDSLNGESVVVGGNHTLNPLDIQPTPSHVLEAEPGLNPYGDKHSSVMAFFETFFENQGEPLGNRRGVLDAVVDATYETKGITEDPSTHHKESPTISNVYEMLRFVAEDPEAFHAEFKDEREITSGELAKWKDRAEDLRIGLQPLKSGQYSNMNGQTDVDLHQSRLLHLDLQQNESGGDLSFELNTLFDIVYERAKETDKKVVLAIDEARHLTKSKSMLDKLETMFRHSRHYNLSIMPITQSVREFTKHEEAETILGLCSIKQFLRHESLSAEYNDLLGISERERKFIKSMKAGKRERGYSMSFIKVGDTGSFPVKISAMPAEEQYIDPIDDGTKSEEQKDTQTPLAFDGGRDR